VDTTPLRSAARRLLAPALLAAALAGLAACPGTAEAPPCAPENAGTAEAARRPAAITDKDCERQAARLQTRLPHGFTVVTACPFVVAGDEDAHTVRARADRTVRWAVRMLKKDYFTRDPEHVITIYLFRDRPSYLKHARLLFEQEPPSPYGYYSAEHRALVMNIATGGGTLVHEMVHPFVSADFPRCPAWLNEGLASLYEQCAERDGHIHGLTNWRLAGLQKAIRDGKLPSFRELTATTDAGFYGEGSPLRYAQARYLCYYLQEKGLLVRFYREFRRDAPRDPTGYRTLQRVLDESDMHAFQKRWQDFVLRLRFP
jgi:hypothetical protein